MKSIVQELIEKYKKNSRLNKIDGKIFEEYLENSIREDTYNEDIETLIFDGPVENSMAAISNSLAKLDNKEGHILIEKFINSKRVQENASGFSGNRFVFLFSKTYQNSEIDININYKIFAAMVLYTYKQNTDTIYKKNKSLIELLIIPIIVSNHNDLSLEFINSDQLWEKTRELFMRSVLESNNREVKIIDTIYIWLKSTGRNMGKYNEEYLTKLIMYENEIESDGNSLNETNNNMTNNFSNEELLLTSVGIIYNMLNEHSGLIKILTKDNNSLNDRNNMLLEKLNKTIATMQLQNEKIINLNCENEKIIDEKHILIYEKNKLQDMFNMLNVELTNTKKELHEREQFSDVILRNKEIKGQEFLNKLASQFKIDYQDFCDAKNLKMSIDLGENMRSQLENVFSILMKSGLKM